MAKKNQSQPAAEKNRFTAYAVRDFEKAGEKKTDWNRIGVAFPHADGKGFNVELQALPVDGKIVLRQYEPKTDESHEG